MVSNMPAIWHVKLQQADFHYTRVCFANQRVKHIFAFIFLKLREN